jgi:hypothetical protein
MITKEQIINAMETISEEIGSNLVGAYNLVDRYIVQMEAIAARYNYLRNASDSCEQDRVDVVVWTECDGGNMGDAIRGDNLDDYIDNEISKETK